MDRNGYNKSILNTEYGTCFICGKSGHTHRHEVFGGARRTASKKHGLWVNLCPDCHRRVHKDGSLALDLKEITQKEFMKNHTLKEFMNIAFRNYI